MSRLSDIARSEGYLHALRGHQKQRGAFHPEDRFAYDAGYRDGLMAAACAAGSHSRPLPDAGGLTHDR